MVRGSAQSGRPRLSAKPIDARILSAPALPDTAPDNPSPWFSNLVLLAVLLIGLSGSILAFRALREADALRLRETRGALAQAVLESFSIDLTRTIEAVHNTGLLVESHPQLRRTQFNGFAARTGALLPFLTYLEWQPIVHAKDLAAFEAMARGEGLANYRVVQPKGAEWEPVRGRDDYVPVLYGWPQDSAALGVDIGFYPERMESKLRARTIGRPVASEVFPLIQDGKMAAESAAFAISTAVYQANPKSGEGGALSGYLAAVVQLPLLMEEARSRAEAGKLDLLVYDRSSGVPKPIYLHLGEDSDLTPETAHGERSGDHVMTIDVATRPWEIVLHPRPSFYANQPHSLAFAVLLAGIATTMLLTGALARTQRAQRFSEAARQSAQQAKDNLAAERQRLQDIIEGTNVGTWEYNFADKTLRVNDRWMGMAGYLPDELTPQQRLNWQQFCHPDDRPRVARALRAHMAGETEYYECEYRLRHKEGRWIWIASRARMVHRTPDGRPLLMAGTNLEVTARKEAETRMQELNETLELRVRERTQQLEGALKSLHQSQEELSRSEARATLGTLVAGVSHELGTPMGNSTMTAGTLLAQAQDFHKQVDAGNLRRAELSRFVAQVEEGSALMVRNLERASELLKNFRQVAADQASEQRRSFDLRQAVQEILDTLSPTLKTKVHKVELEIAPGIRMDSYPGPIGQVVINLVNNAYLHAFEGMAQGSFTIAGEADGDTVKLRFTDDGCGITPETLKKMFEPFFSTRIGSGGTGLGMSIVENLVTRTLGGTLKVETKLGRGTSIHITLPLTAPQGR